MSNEYVQAIADGNASLRAFVLRCAEAFDVNLDEQGRIVVDQQPYEQTEEHAELVQDLAAAREQLELLRSRDESEWSKARDAAGKQMELENQQRREDADALRSRYQQMLDKIDSWDTGEQLQGYKNFMSHQLNDAIFWQCTPYQAKLPPDGVEGFKELELAIAHGKISELENQLEVDRSLHERIQRTAQLLAAHLPRN